MPRLLQGETVKEPSFVSFFTERKKKRDQARVRRNEKKKFSQKCCVLDDHFLSESSVLSSEPSLALHPLFTCSGPPSYFHKIFFRSDLVVNHSSKTRHPSVSWDPEDKQHRITYEPVKPVILPEKKLKKRKSLKSLHPKNLKNQKHQQEYNLHSKPKMSNRKN